MDTRSSPSVFLLAAAFALAAACGGSTFVTKSSQDGGVDATTTDAGCTGTPPTCTGICGGPPPAASCIDGAWSCPIVSGACVSDASFPLPDASSPDASPFDAGGGDGGLPCGTLSCDPSTQFCQISNYPIHLDGGADTTYACNAIPVGCQVNPTCTCIQTTSGCQCAEGRDGFTVTCDYP